MSGRQSGMINVIRSRPDCERAVVFLHGFSGNRDDSWDRLPGLLGTVIADWDIFALGYATTFRPDFLGVWSADPDIPILATMLTTHASIDPLAHYRWLTLIAHSMGGLVVQRALLDDPRLTDRTKSVILFGAPSAGLRKASWLVSWKRQMKNMAVGSEFITALRRDWASRFEPEPGFDLRVVAGEQDRFVPPDSSLGPFPREFQYVVPGDHTSMVRPVDTNSPSVRLIESALSNTSIMDEINARLTIAAQLPDSGALELVEEGGDQMSQQDVVRGALALERSGRRDEAMALLQRYQALGTDVQGTLAGRIKRMWIENEDQGFAEHALALYQEALSLAIKMGDVSQIYYHSINIAFLEFVAFDQVERAREMAKMALRNALLAEVDAWSVATQAEANLYLGHNDLALDLYRRMRTFEAEHWEYASAALQAGQVASKLQDIHLAEALEDIFTPDTPPNTSL